VTDKLLDDLKHALGDAYTIERELTGGGMSRVFVAREHALGREVVIKVLPPDLAAGVNRDRFRREVQMAASLSHPYIVPLLNAGAQGELLWFTMPYIAGESLRTTIERRGAMPITEVVRLLHDVVEALAYAHSRGVIHRDIKPGNILSDGHHALVTDFGVAKALNAALPSMGPAGHTTSGMAIGTPAYMAPEQLAADPAADHRMDIYATGLLAYEMLTGESPFSAPSPTATMTAQLTRIPEPLHKMRPEVPPAFSALVQHCLAKSPQDRPADARAVLAELDKISGAIAADVHRGGTGVVVPPSAPRWPLAIAAFAVIALVAGSIYYTTRGPKGIAVMPPPAIGADTGDANALPLLQTKPLTHADSLRIAEALRDELAQLDSKEATKRESKTAIQAADTFALEQRIALTDSLVRVVLERMRSQAGSGFRGGPPLPPPTAATSASGAAMGAQPGSTPTRVLVMAPVWSRSDSTARALSEAAAAELDRRLSNSDHWTIIQPDTTLFAGGRGGPGSRGTGADRAIYFGGYDSTDIRIGVSVLKDQNDSSYLNVSIRNLAPPYGNQIIQSPRVKGPTSVDQFRGTIRQVWRTLDSLRRLPAGTPWPSTVPRQGGRGGPSDFMSPDGQRKMEQQFHRLDSLKVIKPTRPPGG
jgi:serine/threonine protein kinase